MDDEEAKKLKTHLTTKYGMVQFEMSAKQSYLVMEIEINDDGMSITMSSYMNQLLDEIKEQIKTLATYESLGTKETFVVNEETGSLDR